MGVRLNRSAFDHARELIGQRRFVLDDRDLWIEHWPWPHQEKAFIKEHGLGEYARWHLGVDMDEPEDTRGRFKFPYGDFDKVHRCGVLSVEVRAGQYRYQDIKDAAAHLRGMLDSVRPMQR
jgi:hypothetical protein